MKGIAVFAGGRWNSPQQGAASNVLQMAHRKTVKARWLADAQGYRKKRKAPGQLLDSVNNDRSRIEVIRQLLAMRTLSALFSVRGKFKM